MRRDLLIGLLVSVLLHGGLVLGFNRKGAPPAPPPEEVPTLALALPPLEPEEPPPAEPGAAASEPTSLAPPSQPDVITPKLASPFVQTLQPTAPAGILHPAALVTIPPIGNGGPGGDSLAKLFSLAELDQRPEPTLRISPAYPYELRRAGISGTVTVIFTVDSGGSVRDAEILNSTQRDFEGPALQAVLQWKFKPGKRAGRAVNTRMSLPIEFTLFGGT
jgi:protein TonB